MSSRRKRSVRHSSFSISPSSSSSDFNENENIAMPQRQQRAPPRLRRPSRLPANLFVVLIATIGALFHCGHVAHLHENHLSFAYLSNAERELTFRSEMAFYYSFYKQILMSNSFWNGISSLFNDTVTEYPIDSKRIKDWDTASWGILPSLFAEESSTDNGVHVLKRFNVYPEVILAALYRALDYFNMLHSECFEVAIDGIPKIHALAMPPDQINSNSTSPHLRPIGTLSGEHVLSCEGSHEPPIFYVNSVFSLSGLTVFGLVISGWQVANCGSCGSSGAASLAISIWGAVLPLVGFFFNHGEATRVQWSPPLRESFAYPFFILQQSLLIWLLSDISPIRRQPSRRSLHFFGYILLLLAFQLPWQFAQFALLTQLLSLMITYALVAMVMVISPSSHQSASSSTCDVTVVLLCSLARRLLEILGCQMVALTVSWILQFGNRLLLTSMYLPCLAGCFFVHLILLASSCLLFALLVRLLLHHALNIDFSDGAHVVDLIKVKLLRAAPTFHTKLYTCSEVFDFLPTSVWLNLARTALLPGALLAVLVTSRQVLLPFRSDHSASSSSTSQTSKDMNSRTASTANKWGPKGEDSEITEAEAGASTVASSKSRCLQEQILLARSTPILIADVISIFIILQLFAFGFLAMLVMRLKLFFTPQLCLALAILAQPRLFVGCLKILPHVCSTSQRKRKMGGHHHHSSSGTWTPSWRKLILLTAVFVGGIAIAAQRGVQNLREEWSKQGQFSDFTTETLIQWASQLPPNEPDRPWVITGAMPTMATLRASLIVPSNAGQTAAKFAITNHPHYEKAAIRWRTELAYAICSRKPPEAVWRIYRQILKADFVVIDRDWCLSLGARAGCSSVELWDLLDPGMSGSRGPLCETAFAEEPLPTAISRFFTPVFKSTDRSLVVWRISSI
ncbi:hypothetical protein Aperf_G00000057950 [Anoplocephala perfoliata]